MKIAELHYKNKTYKDLWDTFAGSIMKKDDRYYFSNLDTFIKDLIISQTNLKLDDLFREYEDYEDIEGILTYIDIALVNVTNDRFELDIKEVIN